MSKNNDEMINITDKSKCCGCTACACICPQKAITMFPDGMGFLYPVVDYDKCTNCGLCEKVCAFNPDYNRDNNFEQPDVYAVRHKDIAEVETSRSGAVFIALSDWIIENGGVVYGAGYERYFRVVHKRATNKQERNEFKGSKYVQSDLNDVFLQIRGDLKRGIKVLFSGTPCQTSGLLSFLKTVRQDVSNLFVVDLVCHGVPSPYVWRDYLKYIENKYNDKIVSVNFRDKSRIGWTAHKESFVLSSGKCICRSTYTDLFYKHLMFRHSCGVCHFTNFQHPSDVTIADFWGWQNVDNEINSDDKGVSLLLINTNKGKILFNDIAGRIYYIKTDQQHCLQPNLQHPSVISLQRNDFEKDYISKSFVYCAKKYGNIGMVFILKEFLSKVKHKLFR